MKKKAVCLCSLLLALTLLLIGSVLPAAADDHTLTRGDFVTALYHEYLEHGGIPVEQEKDFQRPRASDSQSVEPGGLGTYLIFDDVSIGTDLYYACAWAERHGVTNGTGNGKFSPQKDITLMEAVTMAYRLASAAGLQFPDGPVPEFSPDWSRVPAAWWTRYGETGDDLRRSMGQDAAETVLAALFDNCAIMFR